VDLHMICSPPSSSPADRVGPVGFASPTHIGFALFDQRSPPAGPVSPQTGSVNITRSADPGSVNRLLT
jgi:hypothetical protein